MGTVYNRGTRAKPNWYLSYTDARGRRQRIPSGQPTKAQAKAMLRDLESQAARRKHGLEVAREEHMCGDLLQKWAGGLRNRSAKDDRSRLRRHVLPRFGEMLVTEVTLAELMRWIDDQRAEGKLADATIRHNLNLMSRFFSWAIERGYAELNPVRQIPTGRRPKVARKKDVPWLEDDAIACKLIRELAEPLCYMFYLGNRSGLREGEIVGLRLSDLEFLDERVIRVRHSCDGPLKEDKNDEGKVKWVPAADGCKEYLAPWLARRHEAGAGAEDFVFPGIKNPKSYYRPLQIQRRWREISARFSLGLTFYEATRHTFASRCLAAGASLDEVSAALGHSSPIVTRRFYDHYVRRSFSGPLHQGLPVTPPDADEADSETATDEAATPETPTSESDPNV